MAVVTCWIGSACCVVVWLLLHDRPGRWRRRILPGVPKRIPVPSPRRPWRWQLVRGGLVDAWRLDDGHRTHWLTLDRTEPSGLDRYRPSMQ